MVKVGFLRRRRRFRRVAAAPIALLAGALMLSGGCIRKARDTKEVSVLTYASLGSKEGFLRSVAAKFQEQSGCKLRIDTTLGATQMAAWLRDPEVRENYDVVMGLDEVTAGRFQPFFSIEEDVSLGLSDRILPHLHSRLRPGFIPLDYSALSFLYRVADFPSPKALPRSRRDLLGSGLRKKFILQDPRASSPGQLFFLFLEDAVGLRELRERWLTLAPSWDSSYKMFLAGEAPMVWTYLTSLAYHASKGERDRFGFVEFEEGLPLQVEGMARIQRAPGSPRNPCADEWIRFVLKPETLGLLAEKQWMFPAYSSVALPPFFQHVPPVRKVFELDTDAKAVDARMTNFEKELSGGTR